MDKRDIGLGIAELLLAAAAVRVSRTHPFMFSAGWASPVYVDVRVLMSSPDIRRRTLALLMAYVGDVFRPGAFDLIAGGEVAGIPMAALLADRLDLPFRYVRKRPLGVGGHSQVECGEVSGQKALLFDDLTSDAGTKLAFLRGLRAAGAVVEDALTIFSHALFPGVEERLARAGLRLHALCSWPDILAAPACARLPEAERRLIGEFITDPVGWSARHHGRSALG